MYEDRVAKGAVLLDSVRPGWAAEINSDKLKMYSCDECILGQVYRDFNKGYNIVTSLATDMSIFDLGFDLRLSETDSYADSRGAIAIRFAALADAWRAEIRRRTDPGVKPEPTR